MHGENRRQTLLLAIEGYERFGDLLATSLGLERGRMEKRRFPDQERYLRIQEEVPNRNVILVGGTHSDDALWDVYDASCHLVRTGARSLVLVVPYFGYSTMERATQPGEVVTAKTRARALSSIPVSQTGNSILLMDLHTPGIAHYFGDGLITRHLSARPAVIDCIERLGLDAPVIASTDAGRAKQVADLANHMGLQAAFVYKRRTQDALELTGVNADVSNRPVIIYDDMVRTGGSLLQAANAYLQQGASEVHAVTSHLVLAGQSLDLLLGSPHLSSLSGTDTHPRHAALQERGGHVSTVVPIFREAILSRYPYLAHT